MFLLASEDVLTWNFQTFAAHVRETSRSTDLTDDVAVSLLNEVPEDPGVLHWHMAHHVRVFHYSDGKPIEQNPSYRPSCPRVNSVGVTHPTNVGVANLGMDL